jgi:hypothetical protein
VKPKYNPWISLLKQLFIYAFAIFLISAVIYKLQPIGTEHYQGETEITPTQFVQVKTGMSYLAQNKYTNNADGNIQFTYNFNSDKSFPFLQSSNLEVWDCFPLSAFTNMSSQTSGFNGVFNLLLVLYTVILFWLYFWRKRNPRGYFESFTKLRHSLERLSDNFIKPPQQFEITETVSDINIQDYKGIIAVRVWKIENHKLKSVVQDTIWDKPNVNANKIEENGLEGIYAYRIGSLMRYSGKVMGIVEMQGQYYYHSDIVRAENCVIKCLFVSKGRINLAKSLSNQYGVKVLLGDRKESAYTDWLFSKNGLECWQHNFKLLEDEDGSREES